ncbi:trehalose-phosphatase [Larsenimonas suaedae]|uniref:Trehalose 6-phosphate phosphatase n=1 Tax=Larsenimonas suaedae TaxID=1851019 RepID=A0ABU1GYI4_9GAMM|nr:trehalose-phosphatase [Larsenimonas suaedae]MCM2971375.1 trehalose-phosphatase [Larsenimonas suaedae]MDR5896631.1 trehalose-phosphatase [Larsenimonas suaedae]
MDASSLPAPPCLNLEEQAWALFLDLDGTLAPLQDHPDDVVLSEELLDVLTQLSARLNGAVAIVSGRAIANLDGLISPVKLALAGQHGAERRTVDGTYHAAEQNALMTDIKHALQTFVSAHEGLGLEDKGASLALHYRNAPHHEDALRAHIRKLLEDCEGVVSAHDGKCVIELRTGTAHKGHAIKAFMQEPPFADRTPIFLGDDVTDEDGFNTVNHVNGLSIKVGTGDTTARYRLEGPETVIEWLMTSLNSHR